MPIHVVVDHETSSEFSTLREGRSPPRKIHFLTHSVARKTSAGILRFDPRALRSLTFNEKPETTENSVLERGVLHAQQGEERPPRLRGGAYPDASQAIA